jgi:hypothetical protein
MILASVQDRVTVLAGGISMALYEELQKLRTVVRHSGLFLATVTTGTPALYWFLPQLGASPPPGTEQSWTLSNGSWLLVALMTAVSAAIALIVEIGGTQANRRGGVPGRIAMAAIIMLPSLLLLSSALECRLSLTGKEFVYRSLFSSREHRYAYDQVRSVALLSTGAERVVVQFADGYRFSSRRFPASLSPSALFAIARTVSAHSGVVVDRSVWTPAG